MQTLSTTLFILFISIASVHASEMTGDEMSYTSDVNTAEEAIQAFNENPKIQNEIKNYISQGFSLSTTEPIAIKILSWRGRQGSWDDYLVIQSVDDFRANHMGQSLVSIGGVFRNNGHAKPFLTSRL